MISEPMRRLIRERLKTEVGRVDKEAPYTVALAYPSPYAVAMSSLGYQRIYGLLQDSVGVACERLFLPEGGDRPAARIEAPVSYERLRPMAEFPLVAFSVAYEPELAGVVRMLDASGVPPARVARGAQHPIVLAGGPITFSNPLPLAALADVIVVGEAEETIGPVVAAAREAVSREAALEALARLPHVYVPQHHGPVLPPPGRCSDALLPAVSAIRTPHAELSDMFLIEPERGCSRACAYCVMRRSGGDGMRVVEKERVLELVPADVRRVGLVGAAVSDHPRIVELVTTLARRGHEVGLSSLRPDRLSNELVEALASAGYRTLTTALDGASERLRGLVERRGREAHFLAAAERAKRHGMDRLKLYLIVGLPGEQDEDIDECARFVRELSGVLPVALGVAAFCAKRNTPLDGQPFAGVRRVEERLERLRRALRGRADVRALSARWAWIEHVLSQGGVPEGEAVIEAVRRGGRFSDFRRAFGELGHTTDGGSARAHVSPVPP